MSIVEHQRQETRDRIFRASAWFTEVHEDLKVWTSEGRIFGIDHNGTRHYATYQFSGDGKPLRVVQKILQQLGANDPWAIAAWFEFPNSWISAASAVSPKEVLDNEGLVLHAATRQAGSYIA